MSLLISGSIAYDYIMNFPDSFKHHILPDQIHILNVAFVVDTLKKNLGGTAANIAYTATLLGAEAYMISPFGGADADAFEAHWKQHGISSQYLTKIDGMMNAAAHIMTDKDDNQITAFYPGALTETDGVTLPEGVDASCALVSPTSKELMIAHAKACAERQIPFCFDPGQQLPAFTAQELMLLIGQATFVIGNDYEMKLLEDKTGWDTAELLEHVPHIIITRGSQGSLVITKKEHLDVPVCAVLSVEDPTGAGDAYRAGFFTAYMNGEHLRVCAQTGSVAAAYAVEKHGTQNHIFTREEFAARYEAAYNEVFPLFASAS